jgi:hypothetical protein
MWRKTRNRQPAAGPDRLHRIHLVRISSATTHFDHHCISLPISFRDYACVDLQDILSSSRADKQTCSSTPPDITLHPIIIAPASFGTPSIHVLLSVSTGGGDDIYGLGELHMLLLNLMCSFVLDLYQTLVA